jgi:ribosome-associated translation inhibitor RaiA
VTSLTQRETISAEAVRLVEQGAFADDLADYARAKIAALTGYTSDPIVAAQVRLVRHPDPAIHEPVVVTVSLELSGRTVHAHASASSGRIAVDAVAHKLRRQLIDGSRN